MSVSLGTVDCDAPVDRSDGTGDPVRGPEWGPLDGTPTAVGPLPELREGVRPLDLVAIAAVPSVLAVLFVLLGAAPEWLVLSADDPTALSVVGAHFVHRSADHLLANVAAYAFVAPTGYALAVLSGRRLAFLGWLLAAVLLLPPLLSGLILLGPDGGVTLGFSGVLMALVGLVPLFLGAYVERRFPADGTGTVAPGLFLLGLGLVAARTLPTPELRLGVASLAVLAGLACVLAFGRSALHGGGRVASLRDRDGQVGLVGLGAFSAGLLVGFPGAPSAGPVVVNTYGHLLGYVLGFVVPYAASGILGAAATGGEVDRELV